jgi:hypothetical protein
VMTKIFQEFQGLVAGHRLFPSRRSAQGPWAALERPPWGAGDVIDPKGDSFTKRQPISARKKIN